MYSIDSFIDACESAKIVDTYVDIPYELCCCGEDSVDAALEGMIFGEGGLIEKFVNWVNSIIEKISNWWKSFKGRFKSKKALKNELKEVKTLYEEAKDRIENAEVDNFVTQFKNDELSMRNSSLAARNRDMEDELNEIHISTQAKIGSQQKLIDSQKNELAAQKAQIAALQDLNIAYRQVEEFKSKFEKGYNNVERPLTNLIADFMGYRRKLVECANKYEEYGNVSNERTDRGAAHELHKKFVEEMNAFNGKITAVDVQIKAMNDLTIAIKSDTEKNVATTVKQFKRGAVIGILYGHEVSYVNAIDTVLAEIEAIKNEVVKRRHMKKNHALNEIISLGTKSVECGQKVVNCVQRVCTMLSPAA